MERIGQQVEPENPIGNAGRAIRAWVTLVSAHPRVAIAAVGLLALVALAAASRLGVDTDSSRMLSPDLPFQQRSHELNEAFPQLKNAIVLVVRGAGADAVDAAVDALAARLTRRTDLFDSVFAPSADPYLIAHGLLYLDRDALDARLTRLGKASNLLASLREDQTLPGFLRAVDSALALAGAAGGDSAFDPADLDRFLAETARVLVAQADGRPRAFGWTEALAADSDQADEVLRVITLEPRLDYSRLSPAKPAIAAIGEEIATLDPALSAEVEVGVTGDPVLRAEELASVTSRMFLSNILSLVLVCGLLWLALGSLARTGLALGSLIVTLALTAGFAEAAVGSLNLISIAFVVLMIGLGIDYSIHLIAHLDERLAAGEALGRALGHTAGTIGAALFLSATTTSIAFLAFATTDFVGMAQLGLIGGVGVLIALGVTLTVIPAAVTIWPRLESGPRPRPIWQPPAGLRRLLVWLSVVFGLAGMVLAPQARFDADPMSLRNPEASSVRVYGWLATDSGFAPLRLSVIVPDAQAAKTAVDALKRLPEVRSVRWLGDLVPDDQAAKLDLIDLAYPSILHAVEGTPDKLVESEGEVTPATLAARLDGVEGEAARELASQLRAYAGRASPDAEAALTRALFRYFPQMMDRLHRQLNADEVTMDSLPEPLVARYRAADGRLRVEAVPEADLRDPQALRGFARAVASVEPAAAGPPAQIAGAATAVSDAILQAIGLALLGCGLVSWLTLRDLGRLAVILVPLAMASAATVGASVLLGMPFNYANVIVLPLLIGIGIDSGVHFALREDGEPGSVFDTSTPRAVLYSALTTIAAFGTLGLSEHRGTASMGVLLAVSLVCAVGMVFALTPGLVRLVDRMRRRSVEK